MNSKPLLLAAAIFALATVPALAVSKAYTLDSFDKAKFDTSVHATIVVGGAQSFTAEAADPHVLELLHVEVVDGQLNVWVEGGNIFDLSLFRDDSVRVTVTVPKLVALEAAASSAVDAKGMAGDRIDVAVSSSARVSLSGVTTKSARLEASSAALLVIDGSCTAADVDLSSGALIHGAGFHCVDVNVEASSSAFGRLFATGQVKADVSSSAIVELVGKPAHVDDDTSSGGDVRLL